MVSTFEKSRFLLLLNQPPDDMLLLELVVEESQSCGCMFVVWKVEGRGEGSEEGRKGGGARDEGRKGGV